MKAILLVEQGAPDLLQLAEVDEPVIQNDNEVKVRLNAAAVNPLDTKLRGGAYPLNDLPLILGCDGSGEVVETGAAVTRFKPGDAVYFFHGGISGINGNYAEYTVLHERFLAHKPDSIDDIHAAALPLVVLTAWESLFDRARLQEGQSVYINAGAGGVGHIAIQLAKHAGARVCTTISTPGKADFVKSLGADHIINYKQEDVYQSVMDWTDGQGVDIAMDNIGGLETQALFRLVKFYGDVVSLLLPHADLDWLVARQRNLRFSLEVMLTPQAAGLIEAQQHQTQILEKCASMVDKGQLQVAVSEALPLSEAARAHQMIEDGHTKGKIVLATRS